MCVYYDDHSRSMISMCIPNLTFQYVKLNVGGSLHYTTIGTLTKHDNMLRAMFSGRCQCYVQPFFLVTVAAAVLAGVIIP